MYLYNKHIFIFFIVILNLFPIVVNSQVVYQITKENGDCKGAIELKDTVFGPTSPPIGYGNEMEITADKTSLYYFEKEHNTVWYKFTVHDNATLTFDVTPIDKSNDYDFLLFRYTDTNFCRGIKDKNILPIRTNISRNDPGINSITGLKKEADKEFVHSGPGEQFSKALDVKEDEVYYLVLDNVYDNGSGHRLNLHYTDIEQIPDKNKGKFRLFIIDKETSEPVYSDVDFYYSKSSDKPVFHFDSIERCKIDLDIYQTYFLQILSLGYLNHTEEINFEKPIPEIQNSDDRTKKSKAGKKKSVILRHTSYLNKIRDTVRLEKIKPGRNFIIENIFFVGDKDVFLPTSTPALKHLFNFMKYNPTVHIEIQGHVNFPFQYKPTKKELVKNTTLSNDRAKAVYDYLTRNGISSKRLTYKGYGNTRMIYPYATLPKEERQNRRVEIEITEY